MTQNTPEEFTIVTLNSGKRIACSGLCPAGDRVRLMTLDCGDHAYPRDFGSTLGDEPTACVLAWESCDVTVNPNAIATVERCKWRPGS